MFSHLNESGFPQMVDVSTKKETLRVALAEGRVTLNKKIVSQFDGKDIQTKKGPIIKTAIIAATMAVKNTANIIPFCHPLILTGIRINIVLEKNDLVVSCEVKTNSKTGVEMEALNGVSVACLTLYDMCKSINQSMIIGGIYLVKKTGGKSDFSKE